MESEVEMIRKALEVAPFDGTCMCGVGSPGSDGMARCWMHRQSLESLAALQSLTSRLEDLERITRDLVTSQDARAVIREALEALYFYGEAKYTDLSKSALDALKSVALDKQRLKGWENSYRAQSERIDKMQEQHAAITADLRQELDAMRKSRDDAERDLGTLRMNWESKAALKVENEKLIAERDKLEHLHKLDHALADQKVARVEELEKALWEAHFELHLHTMAYHAENRTSAIHPYMGLGNDLACRAFAIVDAVLTSPTCPTCGSKDRTVLQGECTMQADVADIGLLAGPSEVVVGPDEWHAQEGIGKPRSSGPPYAPNGTPL